MQVKVICTSVIQYSWGSVTNKFVTLCKVGEDNPPIGEYTIHTERPIYKPNEVYTKNTEQADEWKRINLSAYL